MPGCLSANRRSAAGSMLAGVVALMLTLASMPPDLLVFNRSLFEWISLTAKCKEKTSESLGTRAGRGRCSHDRVCQHAARLDENIIPVAQGLSTVPGAPAASGRGTVS